MRAFRDFEALDRFLAEKRDKGVLTSSDFDAILGEFVDVASAAGMFIDHKDPAFAPIVAQAVSCMIRKTLALHPELDHELKAAMAHGRGGLGR